MIDEAMERLRRLEDRGPEGNVHVKLLHTHIAKTAGMSLLALFKEQFPVHIHLPWDRAGAVWADFLQHNDLPRFSSGHITFCEAIAVPKVHSLPLYVITIIREPLERALSLYNYGRSTEYPQNAEFAATYPTIDAYFLALSEERNIQSNWLSGQDSSSEALEVVLGKHYCGIAPLEYMGSYVERLQRAFCHGEPKPLPRKNELGAILHGKEATLSDVSGPVMRKLREANSLDIRLYEATLDYWSRRPQSQLERAVRHLAPYGSRRGAMIRGVYQGIRGPKPAG